MTSPETFAPATALAVVANDTAPLTLLPATALAVAAFVTSPETLAPATAFAVAELVTSPVTFAPTTFDNPPPSPENKPVFAVNATAVTVDATFNPVNVPTDVMFGCVPVVKGPDNV